MNFPDAEPHQASRQRMGDFMQDGAEKEGTEQRCGNDEQDQQMPPTVP
jgi:hypothetical protein